jgi:NAD(P)-dependent dehydrogenase (short-subunit alcohol dehydrogenase family)
LFFAPRYVISHVFVHAMTAECVPLLPWAAFLLHTRHRTEAKCADAAKAIGGGPAVVCGPPLELSSLRSVREFVAFVKGLEEPVHVLVNNAGALVPQHSDVAVEAADGTATRVETTFAANCVGPAALTAGLLPVLARSGTPERCARVVYVSSRLERNAQLDSFLRDVSGCSGAGLGARGRAETVDVGGGGGGGSSGEGNTTSASAASGSYNEWTAYANSKQGNLHCAFAQARQANVKGHRVVVNAVTPGMVNTELGRHLGAVTFALTAPLRWMLLPTPHAGADAIVYAVTAQEIEGQSGRYYGKVCVCMCVGEGGRGGSPFCLMKLVASWLLPLYYMCVARRDRVSCASGSVPMYNLRALAPAHTHAIVVLLCDIFDSMQDRKTGLVGQVEPSEDARDTNLNNRVWGVVTRLVYGAAPPL